MNLKRIAVVLIVAILATMSAGAVYGEEKIIPPKIRDPIYIPGSDFYTGSFYSGEILNNHFVFRNGVAEFFYNKGTKERTLLRVMIFMTAADMRTLKKVLRPILSELGKTGNESMWENSKQLNVGIKDTAGKIKKLWNRKSGKTWTAETSQGLVIKARKSGKLRMAELYFPYTYH